MRRRAIVALALALVIVGSEAAPRLACAIAPPWRAAWLDQWQHTPSRRRIQWQQANRDALDLLGWIQDRCEGT